MHCSCDLCPSKCHVFSHTIPRPSYNKIGQNFTQTLTSLPTHWITPHHFTTILLTLLLSLLLYFPFHRFPFTFQEHAWRSWSEGKHFLIYPAFFYLPSLLCTNPGPLQNEEWKPDYLTSWDAFHVSCNSFNSISHITAYRENMDAPSPPEFLNIYVVLSFTYLADMAGSHPVQYVLQVLQDRRYYINHFPTHINLSKHFRKTAGVVVYNKLNPVQYSNHSPTWQFSTHSNSSYTSVR